MATSTRPSSTKPKAKPAPRGRSTTTGRSGGPSRKPAPSRKVAPTTRRATKPVRTGPSPVAAALRAHWHDLGGLFLVALGLLVGLGVYADSAGPAGRGLAVGARSIVGLMAVFAPPLLVAAGVLLVRGPRVEQDPDHPVARLAVGTAMLVLAVAGVLHVLGPAGSLGADGLDAFTDAGGLLGAAIGQPAESLLAVWGALIVFALLAVGGATLVVGTSLSTVATAARERSAPAARSVSGSLRRWFELGHAPKGAGVPQPFDQDAGAATAVAAAPPEATAEAKAEAGPAAPTTITPKPKPTIVLPANDSFEPPEQIRIDLGPAVESTPWKLPDRKSLNRSSSQEVDARVVEQQGRVLEAALFEHGVETRLVGMVVGPTVTRFELELGVGVKVNRVTSLHKDIAYAMASPDVRILAPIPGRQAIGIEVPNVDRQLVCLGDILSSEEAHRATHPLEVAVGRDITGKAVMMNLATMPHLLIAGQTGAGKSSCINSIITSIMMRSTPDQVRMILVDPKRVELTQYDRIPHLLTQVVTNPKKAANALDWAVKEMERRYDLLSHIGVRDITGYNAAYDRGDLAPQTPEDPEYQRLPFVLVVVDELADLMMVAPRDVEDSICRIAQMARAVGIHLVIATQRPSVNVITGVIKANIPARLAFSVSSSTDSKVILDQQGAERLVGRGDMLLLGPTSGTAQRIQGSWVEEKEVATIVRHWRKQAPEVAYVEGVEGADEGPGLGGSGGGGTEGDDDDLMWQAMELVVRHQLGSTSMLQRKLKVGFARAGRLMDLLEQRGVVGPSEGSKSRAVLMTVQELEELVDQR